MHGQPHIRFTDYSIWRKRMCQVSEGQSSAAHCGVQLSILRQVMGDLWWAHLHMTCSCGGHICTGRVLVVGTSAQDGFLWRPHLHRTGSCGRHICTGWVLVEGTSAQDGFLWRPHLHRTGSCGGHICTGRVLVVGTSAHDGFLWRPHLHRTGSCRGHICTGRVLVEGTSAQDGFLWWAHLHRTGSCGGHICTGRVLVEGTSAQDGFLWWAYMHRTGSCTVLMSPHYPEDGQFTHYARQSLSKPKNKCKFESIMAAIRWSVMSNTSTCVTCFPSDNRTLQLYWRQLDAGSRWRSNHTRETNPTGFSHISLAKCFEIMIKVVLFARIRNALVSNTKMKGYIIAFWRRNYFFNFSTTCI